MKNKLANLDEVLKKLRGFLPQYLAEHEIDIGSNFSCLNPKHSDSNPSMSCAQNPENAYCFSCGATADIFQAAHWLEDKPVSGPGFIQDNVMYLAEKFGIEVELEEMSEEELYRYRTYRAYADAAALISSRNIGDYTKVDEEIVRRGWSPNTTQVGTVEYKAFRDTLKAMGYEARFQDEIDLGRADLFNENNMIFTICDEWGRPVGFAARNLTYDGEHGDKYTNQGTTGLRCNIYQKGRRLYEIHNAIRYTPPLYIFEGYTDVITAQNAGLMNCVAIGGTAFTQQHIELLKQLGIYSVVLVLDGDDAGRDRMANLLDKYFCGNRDLQIDLINLPDGFDPDDFIRQKGIEEFKSLQKWGAFEWRLNRYTDENDPEEICKTMIPLIVNEPSYIAQNKMCGELALFTGIDKKIIASELERLQNEKERHKQRERDVVIDGMISEVRRNPTEAKTLLYEAITKIEQVEDKYNENSFSLESVIEFVEERRKFEESLDGSFAGFNLSESGLKGLGDKLNGMWREDVFMLLAGKENVGKSSMCAQLAFEIATGDNNNACVIYHSIDDSKEQILPRFICQAYGYQDLTMNQIRNPNFFKINDEHGEMILQRRKTGYIELLRLIKDGRIIIKDVSDGASFSFGESLIKYYHRKYPDRHIVYFLDNLHKAPDFGHMETRQKFTALSNKIKHTAVKEHACIFATAELTKLPKGTVPDNNNMAETRALQFDCNFSGLLYNDLHEMNQDAVCFHERNGEILPRIRMGIGKNKITDFKGRLFFDFYPASGLFRYVDTSIAEADMIRQMELCKTSRISSNPRHVFTGHDGDNPEMPK